MRFLEKYFGGSVSFWNITIFGFNAMHVCIQVHIEKYGYICFHPPMYQAGCWWPWYFYVSPNATPWAATFAIGPGLDRSDKQRARTRRKEFGHNFNVDENYYHLMRINGHEEYCGLHSVK